MEELEIYDLKDLYKRLQPALYSKVKELRLNNIYYIDNKMIFLYLSMLWKNSYNLSLNEMVDDILNVSIKELNEFYFNNKGDESDERNNL